MVYCGYHRTNNSQRADAHVSYRWLWVVVGGGGRVWDMLLGVYLHTSPWKLFRAETSSVTSNDFIATLLSLAIKIFDLFSTLVGRDTEEDEDTTIIITKHNRTSGGDDRDTRGCAWL